MSNLDTVQEKRVTNTYTEGDKFKVLTTYVMLGSLVETAKACDISVDTLKSWKKQAWWNRMLAQVRGEENAKISARYRNIILKTQEKLIDRIEKGDIQVTKDGQEIAIPIRAKDLAVIAGIATQQVERLDTEKQMEDTLTVQERLTKIAEDLVKMQLKKKQPVVIDAEIMENA